MSQDCFTLSCLQICTYYYTKNSLPFLEYAYVQTMPFLSVKHLIHREETSGFFVIQVQVDRKSTIYLTGIIIPCILMVTMTLLTFIVKDNYTKLGTSFTTLLMMAVYADQVKNSTPTHVQYLTWIDTFILNNLIINVNATVNSCL